MTEKTQLRLHHIHLGVFDDIEVFNIDTGEPIPFEWVDANMLEVDAQYDRVAAVRVVPLAKKKTAIPGDALLAELVDDELRRLTELGLIPHKKSSPA